MNQERRRQSDNSSSWPLCSGAGQEPAKVVVPERVISRDGKRQMPRGICKKCKRRIAVVSGVVVPHAPYKTNNRMY